MSRMIIESKLKGDIIYRLYSVQEDDTHYEIEVAHRLLFVQPCLRIERMSDALTLYYSLVKG